MLQKLVYFPAFRIINRNLAFSVRSENYELRLLASKCLCMSVCLSIHPSVFMKQLGSHWKDFVEIWYLSFFRNLSRIFNPTRLACTLHEDVFTFMTNLAELFLEWAIFQITFVENIKTHSLFSNFFFRKLFPLYDYVKNMTELESPLTSVWWSVACLISKAKRERKHTHTHTEICNTILTCDIPCIFTECSYFSNTCTIFLFIIHFHWPTCFDPLGSTRKRTPHSTAYITENNIY